MSVAAQPTAAELKERSALATRHFCEELGLGVVPPKQLTYLAIALTEAATEEIRHNQELRARIQTLYQGLLPPPRTTSARGSAVTGRSGGSGTGGARGGSKLAPGNPPDLDVLVRHFSPQEWPGALRKYSMDSLKKAVPPIQEQYPGTAPTSMSKKDAIVEYLLEHLPM